MDERLTPFDLVFGETAGERFPSLQRGLAESGSDPRDRDAFVLVREVVELLRDLRPDDGIGEGVRELVAFVHACYLHWVDGCRRVTVERETLERVLVDPVPMEVGTEAAGASYYLQLAPQRVWGTPVDGSPAEPLDGGFVIPRGDTLSMVMIFGLHPGRPGLTVVEANGSRAAVLKREDGSALFSSKLPGGAAARLLQVVGEAELLELAWRVHGLLAASGAGTGLSRVTFA